MFNFDNWKQSKHKNQSSSSKKLKNLEKKSYPTHPVTFYQYVNFGQHKGKSVYDIANENQHDYIKWLIKQKNFILHKETLSHASIALARNTESPDQWTKIIQGEPPNIYMYYECGPLRSSLIKCDLCRSCNKICIEESLGDEKICWKCKHTSSTVPVENKEQNLFNPQDDGRSPFSQELLKSFPVEKTQVEGKNPSVPYNHISIENLKKFEKNLQQY